jgi:hypothetical protein
MLNNGASQSDCCWCPEYDREGAGVITGCYLSETCALVRTKITSLEEALAPNSTGLHGLLDQICHLEFSRVRKLRVRLP